MAGKRSTANPRHANGNLRRKYRARLKAQGGPCGICGGRLGPIHYDEPSDARHPLSFVVDEIKPVSRWREFGYDKDLIENVVVSISECEPVFTDKEESIRYYLPYLKQHINNLEKELTDKMGHLRKLRTRYNTLQSQIKQMTDYEQVRYNKT